MTCCTATRIEESFLRRNATAIGSSIATISLAKLYVSTMEEKAKQDVAKATESADELRGRARKELAETGTISPETRKQLETLSATEQKTIAAGREASAEGFGGIARRALAP